MTLATGTTLQNRYRIVRLVGQGGFGAVYRGWDTALERPVAVKELFDTGVESQRQFEREARLLAKLRHPNLPTVFDHFVLPDGQYLIMEFVEGKSLHEMLTERGGPLGEAEVLPWIRQVCDALDYLHTQNPPIIHRDVKPENAYISARGRAMLVDFGISKLYDPSKGTTVGAKAVTPGYSPPEQYGRGRTDARSDVYALGATLYTLLTGKIPPEAPDLSSGADVLMPPRAVNHAVSEAVSRAVVAAMATTISQRLGSARELGERLSPVEPPSLPLSPALSIPTMRVGAPATLGPKVEKGAGARLWGVGLGTMALVAISIWGLWAYLALNGGNKRVSEGGPTAVGVEVATETQRPTATTMVATPTVEASPTTEPSPTITLIPKPSLTATATATPEPQAGDIRVVNRGGVAVEQVYVPTGSFMMGSGDGVPDERPVHEVTLDGYWFDRTEVTNAQFSAFVTDTGYETGVEEHGSGITYGAGGWEPIKGADWHHPRGPDTNLSGLEEHPVVLVMWKDAEAFCHWADARLPTEAEWEYAARGPANLAYPWGDTFDNRRLNLCDSRCPAYYVDRTVDDGYTFTAPVGQFPGGASWVGALDLAGNVWEWVNDWYDDDYYSEPPSRNPLGPASGSYHVSRGGSWSLDGSWARSSNRERTTPDGSYGLGFRCAQN